MLRSPRIPPLRLGFFSPQNRAVAVHTSLTKDYKVSGNNGHTERSFFSTALRRTDGLTLYASILVWAGVAAYSGFVNGDAFLLMMPLIFIMMSVGIYVISSSYQRGAMFGASVIAVSNTVLLYRYPI